MPVVPMTSHPLPRRPCGRPRPRRSDHLLWPKSVLAGSMQAKSWERTKRLENLAVRKARHHRRRSVGASGNRRQSVNPRKSVDKLDRNGPVRRPQRLRQILSWWAHEKRRGNGASSRQQPPDHAMHKAMVRVGRMSADRSGRRRHTTPRLLSGATEMKALLLRRGSPLRPAAA